MAALLALALVGCSQRKHDVGATATYTLGPSIYPLSVSLRDERDATVGLDLYRGHPAVIAMFYGSCPVACPLIVSHVKEVDARLSKQAHDGLRVVLVSFDPARDTPPALAGIATARALDLKRWTLATAPEDDVRQIAAVLGVSYRALPDGSFAHDSVITVLDRQGRTVVRWDDPAADVAPLVDAIEWANAH